MLDSWFECHFEVHLCMCQKTGGKKKETNEEKRRVEKFNSLRRRRKRKKGKKGKKQMNKNKCVNIGKNFGYQSKSIAPLITCRQIQMLSFQVQSQF